MAKHYQYSLLIQDDTGAIVAQVPAAQTEETNSLDGINDLGTQGWRHHTSFPVPDNPTLLTHVMEKEFDQDEWDEFIAGG